MSKSTTPLSREEALQAMGALCARCEQCEADLRLKMYRRGVSAADADFVIDFLREHNFLNDQRFAETYALDKHRFNGWGRIKIRMMLRAKRIAADEVERALGCIDEAEYEARLLELVRIKARGLELSDAADRQRVLRALYSRGFEPALTSRAIRRLREEGRRDA